ncbi:MAG: 16S rRNA (uracil(1498)-N(3))-methyltransferase [Nitrospirota bacterium]
MPRIYLPITHPKDGRIPITDEKARYLTSVLRCRKGDDLIVFDGEGNCFRTGILKADRREVVVEILEKFSCNTEPYLNIILLQGLLKGEKMDVVIQKTTELGVKEIIPVITERSQLRETRKVARWRKIAEEAARQSGRTKIPVIHEALDFKSLLTVHYSLLLNGLIFYEEGGMKISEAVSSFLTPHSPLFVVIGPEGGFTKKEVALAREKGLLVTSLGKRILRAETATISAVTIVQFLLGDMD